MKILVLSLAGERNDQRQVQDLSKKIASIYSGNPALKMGVTFEHITLPLPEKTKSIGSALRTWTDPVSVGELSALGIGGSSPDLVIGIGAVAGVALGIKEASGNTTKVIMVNPGSDGAIHRFDQRAFDVLVMPGQSDEQNVVTYSTETHQSCNRLWSVAAAIVGKLNHSASAEGASPA